MDTNKQELWHGVRRNAPIADDIYHASGDKWRHLSNERPMSSCSYFALLVFTRVDQSASPTRLAARLLGVIPLRLPIAPIIVLFRMRKGAKVCPA